MHIPRIHKNSFFIGGITTTTYLPNTSNPWWYKIKVINIIAVFYNFISNNRSWPYEAHVPNKNIPQLWQFIKTCFSKELSDFCNPRIILQFKISFPFFTSSWIIF